MKKVYELVFSNGEKIQYSLEAQDENALKAFAEQKFMKNRILEDKDSVYNLSQIVRYTEVKNG